MPKKNRAYKKGAPHRDARLFVIVAEGKREDEYFSWFNEKNQRIKVSIIPREQNRSAPTHFLSRVGSFIEAGGWNPEDDDQLWFVLDVDKWQREEIENLRIACESNPNWRIAISNPCFEVWLLFHIRKSIPDNGEGCGSLKQMLHRNAPGGYDKDAFCEKIELAVQNSRAADNNPRGHFPDRMMTKLYQLAEEIIPILGTNWK